MAVRIEKVSVTGLGPLKKFEQTFSRFNVIFSPNEKGKTYLTEFILRSLFRNRKRWKHIRSGGKGKVWVSGLEEQSLAFSPSSKEKLEDFWEEQYGLPSSISNILMAKGAEASISSEGIDKHTIKEVLSGINVLDNIDKKISRTIQTAKIEGNFIDIKKQGEGKELMKAEKELEEIKKLSRKMETDYTVGISEDYKQKIKEKQKQIEQLREAKKYRAWMISEKMKKIQEEGSRYPEEDISQLQQDIRIYEDTGDEYKKKKQEYEEAAKQSSQLDWLRSAKENYREWTINRAFSLNRLYYVLTVILALASMIFIAFNMKIAALIAFLGTMGSIFVILKKLYDFTREYGKHKELQKLKTEFENLFERSLTDISVLEEELQKQEKQAQKAEYAKNEMEEKEQKLNSLKNRIQEQFNTLWEEIPGENQWSNTLSTIKQRRKELTDQYKQEQKKLVSLKVNESDFRTTDPGVAYSEEKYVELEQELEALKKKLGANEEQLTTLKHQICGVTKDDFHTSWEKVMENLRNKEEEKKEELKEIKSQIVAGIVVHNLIDEYRKQENQKMQEGLASETVTKPLWDITQRYTSLSLENNALIVSDNFDDYDLQDLSTGAKEQIMLALRIGFSRKLLKKDALFLIMDDTFQHSDWSKREVLVNKLAEIAGMGWQIIYFTMDNHIDELFQKAGSGMGKDFRRMEL